MMMGAEPNDLPNGACNSKRRTGQRRFAGGVASDVFHGDTGDLGESLLSEKRLVRGDQHVGKSKQTGQFVVGEHGAGEIFEKHPRFLLVDIETNAADMAGFERTVRVNLFGTFRVLSQSAAGMVTLEPMADGERGLIVNTASVAAQDGQIGQAA
jgi:NAD(P)-dependent dehydrogenase (short-subunit alcohol dehydrogenase family)